MLIKNKIIIIIIYTLSLVVYNSNLHAEEFNISALEVSIDKENDIVIGKGAVEAADSEGNIINADKVTYEKSKELLLAEGSVKASDVVGNTIIADKISYDKLKKYYNC